MTVQLIQAIVLACQVGGSNPAVSYKKTAENQRICVMTIGVCMRNKEIDGEGKKVPRNEGLDLLNCITGSRLEFQ